MRLILALIIFNFDMKLADESRDWIKQKNYLTWYKPPLKVHLRRGMISYDSIMTKIRTEQEV